MNSLWKAVLTFLGVAALLVGWGVTWANQSAKICANRSDIDALKREVCSVSGQASESEKATVRMETKIECIIKFLCVHPQIAR